MIVQSTNYNFHIDYFYSEKLKKDIFINVEYGKLTVEYFDSKLILNFDFYIAQKFFLPTDAINVTLQLPSQEISNVIAIRSTDAIDSSINLVDKENISIFKARAIIDTTSDSFFQNNYINCMIPIKCYFKVNANSLTNNKVQLNRNYFWQFISEINSQVIDFNFDYSNFYYFSNFNENENKLKFSYEISIDSLNNVLIKEQNVLFVLPKIKNNNLPIKKLFNLNTTTNDYFFIKNIKINIEIQNDKETIFIKKNLLENFKFKNFFEFNFNYEIYFDSYNNKYDLQKGSNGIKFNTKAKIKYQINFDLINSSRVVNCLVENNINWENELINDVRILQNNEIKFNNYEVIYEK